jgi:hypothetical protein
MYAFGLTVPGEPAVIGLRNKAPALKAVLWVPDPSPASGRREQIASLSTCGEGVRERMDATWRCHGKEPQRSAAGNASGIDGTVRPKAL